ncbi:MAG: hypothetical protein ACRDNS_32700 [Trebonia sp.]
MRSLEIIAIVIGVFFAAGIAVGVLLVITLPLVRAMLWHRRHRRSYRRDGNWSKLSADDDRRPPRWPNG